ncbi:YlmC/YmxH family sporulation protein [Metasolibacillus meyeri]|uniref:YlmC/YmxH family sporulation protein n=1 Tax=Metasolibacillus meyeri TaxID=1071052 RepID=A0AAW9NTQ6_9BACL|nr:YlmC/YmxH family sporulation protein [Metasolibacillus meyeri]MEC1179300.1 YlmC/YmxH family sporulation protein [Metasolibacillus meyeri]
MLLSELADKELIEMQNGVRYGFLADTECLFEPTTGKIIGFELMPQTKLMFQKRKSGAAFIPWEEIALIGEDRILFNKTTTTFRSYDQ